MYNTCKSPQITQLPGNQTTSSCRTSKESEINFDLKHDKTRRGFDRRLHIPQKRNIETRASQTRPVLRVQNDSSGSVQCVFCARNRLKHRFEHLCTIVRLIFCDSLYRDFLTEWMLLRFTGCKNVHNQNSLKSVLPYLRMPGTECDKRKPIISLSSLRHGGLSSYPYLPIA